MNTTKNNEKKLKPSKDHIIIRKTIREAGKIALKWFEKDPKTWKKNDGSDVSEADIEIDNYLQQTLTKKINKVGWLSEENKDNQTRLDFDKVLLVDPIDGTKSFLEKKKDFCISIALVLKGRPISGLILNPIKNELYEAELNKGSWLNSKQIFTTKATNLENSNMCAFRPMFFHPAWKRPWPKMNIINKNSIAYRMSLVAKGEFDAMMALNKKNDWDLAAGDLIISEAGGKVTDHKGRKLIYNKNKTIKKSIIGSCRDLHPKIIERVEEIDL